LRATLTYTKPEEYKHSPFPDIPYGYDPFGKFGWRLQNSRLVNYTEQTYTIENDGTLAELFEDIQYLRAFGKLRNRLVVKIVIELDNDNDITGSD